MQKILTVVGLLCDTATFCCEIFKMGFRIKSYCLLGEERADTMIPELWENVNSFTMIIVCGLVIVSVIANAIRLSIRPDMLSAFHVSFIFFSISTVCLDSTEAKLLLPGSSSSSALLR